MRLAILGGGDECLRLIRWAVSHGRHQCVAAYAPGSSASELRSLAPAIRTSDNWEELLSLSVDGVLVAAADPSAPKGAANSLDVRGEQLRRLVQAGMPLIVVCPACEAIVGFEVEMICLDLGGQIIPWFPRQLHPVFSRLQSLINQPSESPIGRVEQVAVEREQIDRSRRAVLTALPRDIGLVRPLMGRVQSVSATGPALPVGRDPLGPKPKEAPQLANLTVALGGSAGITARWTITPPGVHEQVRLTLIGERGKAVLTMPVTGDWSLDIAGDRFTTESLPPADDFPALFSRLENPSSATATASDWLAACRDQEAAEAVDRSLVRGRTIELFHEEHTEAASFKGIMAMGGCLLLMLALCVLLLVSLVEGLQLPLRNLAIWRLWPLYLLLPIGLFLVLQLLGLALKAPLRRSPRPSTSATE